MYDKRTNIFIVDIFLGVFLCSGVTSHWECSIIRRTSFSLYRCSSAKSYTKGARPRFESVTYLAAGGRVCGVVMSTIPKRKHKHSDIEANYRNETKTFLFGPHTIGTKAKHFDLVQNNFFCKQMFSVVAQKFWDKAKQFDLVCKLS